MGRKQLISKYSILVSKYINIAETKFSNLAKSLSKLSTTQKTILVLVASLMTILLRKPDILHGPQFWAEEGPTFFEDAYNNGPSSIFQPYSGSLQMYMRLVGAVTVHFPISLGPHLFALASVVMMLVPIFIIWSSPTLLLGGIKQRYLLLFTYLYLLLPHLNEVYGNLTNSGWYLAVAAALVIMRPPLQNSKSWLAFDVFILLLSGLTGPYCLMLLLPAAYLAWKNKNKNAYIKLGVVALCSLIQLGINVTSAQPSTYNLKPQIPALVHEYQRPIRITGMRLIEVPVAGNGVVNDAVAKSNQAYILGLIVLLFFILAIIRSETRIRALLIFCFIVYALSMLRAQSITVLDFWKMLQYSDRLGGRYFFVPFLGWLVVLIVLANQKGKSLYRQGAISLLALFAIIFPASFHIDPLQDLHYGNYASNFNTVRSGETSCTQINPGIPMCLRKH